MENTRQICLRPSEQTPGVVSEFPTLSSAATFEISRRGALGGSGLVTDGKGLIYIGVDREAQQVQDARNQEIGLGTCAPEAPIETKPYTAWLAKRDETEETVFADDPQIAVLVDGGHAYLETDANGFDAFVRVLPIAEVAVAA